MSRAAKVLKKFEEGMKTIATINPRIFVREGALKGSSSLHKRIPENLQPALTALIEDAAGKSAAAKEVFDTLEDKYSNVVCLRVDNIDGWIYASRGDWSVDGPIKEPANVTEKFFVALCDALAKQ